MAGTADRSEMETFAERLVVAVEERGRLCVGLDPHPELLAAWGLPDSPAGLASFCERVVAALGDRVAVIKPQSAFFERFGSAGLAVLESTFRQLHEAGALVLLDVKRGDIGSTAAAYAYAYLDPSAALRADAITVSPYLGFGALRPMIDQALATGAGVFVVALSSNPEATELQHARRADGRSVAQAILDDVAQVNAGVRPMGSVGVVVGATIGATGHDFINVNGPILAPGLGTQGGTPEGLRTVFGSNLSGVLPSCSREVLAAGPGIDDLRAAADRVRTLCHNVLMSDR
jgi:orotidine-5'-phosphate decarboxylase